MEHASTLSSPAEPAALISLRGAVKRYGRRAILNVAELDIGEGDRIQLIGANGSGKSTLARILARHGSPTSGQIAFRGAARGPVALLPQSGGFYRQMTLFQNLVAIARLHGRRSELNEYTEHAVTALGLAPYLDRPVVNLSGGMQRLAGIACVFGAQPAALILDEPFAGLDAEKAQRVRDLLQSHTGGFHFLMVLGHQPDDTLGLPRIIRITGGEIAAGTAGAST